jgi:hypothetical protein
MLIPALVDFGGCHATWSWMRAQRPTGGYLAGGCGEVGGQSCCEQKVEHAETEEETQERCPDCRGGVWRGDPLRVRVLGRRRGGGGGG